MKIDIIVQARYSSSRLPGKILKKINNKTLFEILILRLKKIKNINNIIIACTDNYNDIKIIKLCKKMNLKYYIGSEKNVLERFYLAAKKYKSKNIIRVTSDCPLIDPKIVNEGVKIFFNKKVDYLSNCYPPTFPDGLDFEIFKFNSLKKAYFNSKNIIEKEHLTQYIVNNSKFSKFNFENKKDFSQIRLTVDYYKDYLLIKKIFQKFKNNFYISFKEILKLYNADKNLFRLNKNIDRNESMKINSGQKIWERAKKIIPGGVMLFSKNPDLILPKFWPAYYSKAKGCKIWDLDNNLYQDLSYMGVGTNILGYSRNEIDNAVIKSLKDSNMSTLNSKYEVLLAEKLTKMHTWAQMVKFARTGGEALSMSIRIARAATGKDNVAVCGYHGWHDWYLSANLKKKKQFK